MPARAITPTDMRIPIYVWPAEKQKDLEYKADQERLKDENLHLRQRVTRELERCRSLERDLTMLERDMEMEEEMYVVAIALLRRSLSKRPCSKQWSTHSAS